MSLFADSPNGPVELDEEQEKSVSLLIGIGAYIDGIVRLIAELQQFNPIYTHLYQYDQLQRLACAVGTVNESTLHAVGDCLEHYMCAVFHLNETEGAATMSREQIREHLLRAGVELDNNALIDYGGPSLRQRP